MYYVEQKGVKYVVKNGDKVITSPTNYITARRIMSKLNKKYWRKQKNVC